MSLQHFSYQAFDASGKAHNGKISAESERAALLLLQSRQLTPVQLKAVAAGQRASTRGSKVKANDVLEFTNALRTMVDARVPLDKALRLLEGITESPAMKQLVTALRRDVKEGKSLADAMENRPDVFSRMYINIVRAGEEGGILHQLLPDLTLFLETSARNRQAIIAAMIYPLVLLVTGIISVLLLLVFVIPRFAVMFADAGTDVPASAAFLLATSNIVSDWGWLFVVLVAAAVFWWYWQDREPQTRLKKHARLLRLPLLGQLLLYRECAVFARTLGALLAAGIPLIRALRVSREVVSNAEIVRLLTLVEEDVRSGASLGLSLEKAGVFPTLLHQLVAVGEETGRTASILLKTAETFDQSVKSQMDRLVAALQPALILVLGIAVGGITITMLSAVFSMNAVQF